MRLERFSYCVTESKIAFLVDKGGNRCFKDNICKTLGEGVRYQEDEKENTIHLKRTQGSKNSF